VGFDSDRADIFDAQRRFILGSPIPLAMIGVLAALPGTALWRRLQGTGRLRERVDGDQFGRANFTPMMDEEVLLRGYRGLMRDVYSAPAYYRRCENYLDNVGHIPISGDQGLEDIAYFLKIALRLGLWSPRRRLFWKLLARARKAAPHAFKWAVVKALQGEHMIRYTEEHVLPRLDRAIAEVVAERRAAAVSVEALPGSLPAPVVEPVALPLLAEPCESARPSSLVVE
jgi:hypothetical protein